MKVLQNATAKMLNFFAKMAVRLWKLVENFCPHGATSKIFFGSFRRFLLLLGSGIRQKNERREGTP